MAKYDGDLEILSRLSGSDPCFDGASETLTNADIALSYNKMDIALPMMTVCVERHLGTSSPHGAILTSEQQTSVRCMSMH
jgi:hypothetical protein